MAGEIAAVWNELRYQLSRFGFDRLNYGYSPALHDPDNISRSMRFALSSHPDTRVRDIYIGPRLDRSPMRIWAGRNVGALSWAEAPRLLQEYGMVDIADELDALLKRLGVHAGYTIAFPPNGRNGRGSMGLTAREGLTQDDVDRIWDRHGAEIMALASAAHGRLTHMPLPLKGYKVTDRQRELLGWIADGKSVQDVAVLTGLSVSAVEKHLARARAGLEAETTAQAIARLALLNQLHMPSAE
ncbi:helix-turn-helix transcriptional regulator [Pseudooceanicola sp. LIPI14-2-Ac024]|uniref:helix-turn-helix transcriptional regulator n=1 Tax=Pseudooceanicola sp. LIPI14-2-Ac024 TaxID=3344875 RepID=UPI0035D0AEF2